MDLIESVETSEALLECDPEASEEEVAKLGHDAFFKTSMQDSRIAEDFFKAHLPKELSRQIRWDTLKLESVEFLTQDGQSRRGDILYSLELLGEIGYIYFLTEHFSSPDKRMPTRITEYECLMCNSLTPTYWTCIHRQCVLWQNVIYLSLPR